MEVVVSGARALVFADGTPVRAASALAPFGGGYLVAQDDATHGCWWRGGAGTRLRLLPPVEGLDTFEEAAGTKHLKPDLEAAVPLDDGALLLGSGATPARTRSVLLRSPDADPVVADLARVQARLRDALGVPPEVLNLEGACRVGDRLRWFHRGLPAAGDPSAAVDLPLDAFLAAAHGGSDDVDVLAVQHLDLGEDLAVTDAVSLEPDTGEPLLLLSAAQEDTPNAYDDGQVLGSALALLRGTEVLAVAHLPLVDGAVAKVEGLAVTRRTGDVVDLVACVDADDPAVPSTLLELRASW